MKDEKTLISIIVPVYRTEKYLDRCVESIVNQTYKNLEIILVDDGSPDDCPKMCDEWAKKDKRIKVIHKENGGVSSARNIGIKSAKGKYIGFVDSDDYIEKEMYESLIDVLNKNKNLDYIYCDIYDAEKINNHSREDYKIISKIEKIEAIFPFNASIWNGIFSRKIINENNIRFDENYFFAEDLIFLIQYLDKSSNKIIHFEKKLYHYVQNNESITHTTNNRKYNQNAINYFMAVKFTYQFLENTKTDIITNKYLDFMFHLLMKNINSNIKKEIINELKKQKKFFKVKHKLYYILLCINNNSLVMIHNIKRIRSNHANN